MRCQWWEGLRHQCGSNATVRVSKHLAGDDSRSELLVCDEHEKAFPPEVTRERLEQ